MTLSKTYIAPWWRFDVSCRGTSGSNDGLELCTSARYAKHCKWGKLSEDRYNSWQAAKTACIEKGDMCFGVYDSDCEYGPSDKEPAGDIYLCASSKVNSKSLVDPTNFDVMTCETSKCSATGISGRSACCASRSPYYVNQNGPTANIATCRDGYVPKRVGLCASDPWGLYTCCPPSDYFKNVNKTTSKAAVLWSEGTTTEKDEPPLTALAPVIHESCVFEKPKLGWYLLLFLGVAADVPNGVHACSCNSVVCARRTHSVREIHGGGGGPFCGHVHGESEVEKERQRDRERGRDRERKRERERERERERRGCVWVCARGLRKYGCA